MPWPLPSAAAASRPSYQQKLAWALEDNPRLLTGEGHLAPLRAILRLIDALARRRGRRDRPSRLPRLSPGGAHRQAARRRAGLPDLHRALAHPAVRTLRSRREPVTRDDHGRPLCANCFITDPANLETCTGCGRRRRVERRTPDGPLCSALPHAAAADVLHLRPDHAVRHLPRHRPALVPGLPAADRPPARRAAASRRSPPAPWPIRSAPAAPRPRPGRGCPVCSDPGHPHPGQCARCLINRRLDELMGPSTGCLPPGLQDPAPGASPPPSTPSRRCAG